MDPSLGPRFWMIEKLEPVLVTHGVKGVGILPILLTWVEYLKNTLILSIMEI